MKTNNVTTQKLKTIEQSHLDANFATLESALTIPFYRVGVFKFCETSNLGIRKFFRKSRRNGISQKLQKFEQSSSDARFATTEHTLTMSGL